MPDKQDLAEDRTDWAEDRTDWAEDRTNLANERTFAGWMRTGMACLGIAVALQAVFGPVEPTWLAKSAASIFIAIGIFIFLTAMRNSKKMNARLNSHTAEPVSGRYMQIIAGVLVFGSLCSAFVLWVI